jgi:gamma-glutamyltranspeptidase
MLSEQPVLGKRGMVATAHYFATHAGLQILTHGGNAIDAAIAAVAVMAIVYPSTCSAGGNVFMLILEAKVQRLYGLDGSGRAPQRLMPVPVYFAARGIHDMALGTMGGWHGTCTNYSYQSRYAYF